MRIGVDIRALLEGKRTGIEEYTINLLNQIFEIDSSNQYFLFYNSLRPVKLPKFNHSNVKVCAYHFPNRLFNVCLRLARIPKIDRLLPQKCDLFFLPAFRLAPLSRKCKSVVTFHDLSYEIFPEFFSWERRLWNKIMEPRRLARRADKIIADSYSTKQDLIRLYKIRPEKIKVIYLGIDRRFRPLPHDNHNSLRIKKTYQLPEKFILYLGTIEPRKNIEALLEAYRAIIQKGFKERLVIAGIKGWLFKEVFQKVKELNLEEQVVFTGFVKDKDKPYLYNLASLFVYPSFYEGFGFPPLEAMASGVPVITSHNSSIPEVVGNGAIQINPYDPREIYFAIKEILTDFRLRETLVQKGKEQAKKFSWEKTARETLEVFETV